MLEVRHESRDATMKPTARVQDGLMDAVRRLRDFEDEDYLLEGLRARAVALWLL